MTTQGGFRVRLDAVAAIADPVDRAFAAGELGLEIRAESERAMSQAGRLRGEAIAAARRDHGWTQAQAGKRFGLTPGRVSQLERLAAGGEPEPVPPVVTGWAGGDQAVLASIAICGSEADGSRIEQVRAAVVALAELLIRRRYEVSHGPQGVGAEVITWIADHQHPDGLDAARGIFGHENVVRDADYMLIVGGGGGTMTEAEIAISTGKRLLPMPASGGTAETIYMRMARDAGLRQWLPRDTFQALLLADASEYAQMAEAVIGKEG
jgi:transcriptional regulator with XRE-family HTH domain